MGGRTVTTSPLRVARALLALLALACVGFVGAHADAQKHRASEAEVLRALLDVGYTHDLSNSIAGRLEVLLYDHFDEVDDQTLGYAEEWVTDSLSDVPRDLINDFRRVAADHSRIEPFDLDRGELHLLADSTLAHFFGRRKPGWESFRRAFPRGTGIISLSRVGLSHDGRWAILYIDQSGDYLGGGGDLNILHKEGGIWRLRYSKGLWIS
jgi:hypothetical protein